MAVTLVSTGAGLLGGPITTTGTISLAPASGASLGGVRAGGNISIAVDGTISVATGSTTQPGVVQLDNSTSSTSVSRAATANAVKVAFDAAIDANNLAAAALPLTGGAMLGPIIFSSNQTLDNVFFPPATATTTGVVRVGNGLAITSQGILSTINNGTVTSITTGPGLGAPASGNSITTSGVIKLLPPTYDGNTIGGVKAGPNIRIEVDGEITTENLLQTNNPYAYNSYIWPVTPSPIPSAPGDNGQVLTLLDKVTGQLGWTSKGAINQVSAGAGMFTTTVNGVATVSLAPVGVAPATVGATGLISTFTVNQYGQIVSYGVANPYSPFQIASTSVPGQLTLNFEDNNTHWEWTLQGNTAIQSPVNSQSGQTGAILLRQNPISPFVVTWHSDWKWSGTPYSGNPVAGGVDFIEFTVVEPNYIVVTNVVSGVGSPAPSPSGSVTLVNTGTGLTGGPITTSGTVSLDTSFTDARYLRLTGGSMSGSIVPSSDNAYDLGSPAFQWRDIYVSGSSIYLSGNKLSVDGGVLKLNSQAVGSGSVTSISAGSGLQVDGGGTAITTSGTLSLTNTSVSPGSYTYGSFSVDSKGRITSAASGVTPVTPNDFSSKGDLLVGDSLGSFVSLPSGTNGQVLSVNNASSSGLQWITPAASGVTSITAGTGLDGGTITGTGTIALSDTGVTAGSYTNASITVDAQGRLTSASSGSAPVTAVFVSSPLTSTGGSTPSLGVLNATTSSPGVVEIATCSEAITGTSCSLVPPVAFSVPKTDGMSGVAILPAGSTSDRPSSPILGGTRINTECKAIEFYTGSSYLPVGRGRTDSDTNLFIGSFALSCVCSIAVNNVAIGCKTMELNQGGKENVAIGNCALSQHLTGESNVAIGFQSGALSSGGQFNTALGTSTLFRNFLGCENVAIGSAAMCGKISGSCLQYRQNVAIGSFSAANIDSGCNNIFIGVRSATCLSSGCGNVGLGFSALDLLTTGCGNVEIGAFDPVSNSYAPPFTVTTENNRLVLGSTATTNAYVQVPWTVVSDERDKTEIKPLALGLDFVSHLDPISYRFRECRSSDVAVGDTHYGFSAQQVLELEGDNSVIINAENPDKLKMTDSHLIPVLVQAIKELKDEVDALKSHLTSL